MRIIQGSFARGSGVVWGGLPLVTADYLLPLLTLTRAQASGARATSVTSAGNAVTEFNADIARFNGTARDLLVEGQRTNAVRNVRGEGASAGTPGTAPTNWSANTTGSGITREITLGTDGGLTYVDFRYFGTNTSGNVLQLGIAPDGNTAIAASEGQTYTGSAYVKLAGGTLDGINFITILTRSRNAGGTQLNATSVGIIPTSADLLTQRYSATRLMPALTAFVQTQILINVPDGGVIDITLRVAGWQLALETAPSSLVLPASGTPAASTRGADIITGTLASLGIAANGACTIIGITTMPANAPTGVNQSLVELSDGTVNNRYMIRNAGGGASIVGARVTASALLDAPSAGDMIAGTPYKFGISIDGAGKLSTCLNGGVVTEVLGGPTTGLTTLHVGNNAAGTAPGFIALTSLRAQAGAVSNATLRQLVLEAIP